MEATKLTTIEHEPIVSVGLMTGAEAASFELEGEFASDRDLRLQPGGYRVCADDGRIELRDAQDRTLQVERELRLTPVGAPSFVVRDVTIGINFHWQRQQDQRFEGALKVELDTNGRLTVVNEVSIEAYLTSVISSEMSAQAHPELLKAHSIVSRGWLLAQIEPWKRARRKPSFEIQTSDGSKQLIRWYDRESHADFDVCADDHCQRYQGVTKASSPEVHEAIRATFGQVLAFGDELCDARYSKSCGGMTESFDAAWEDAKLPYLTVSYDGEHFPSEFKLPLIDEANAEKWIRHSPPAFCHAGDGAILGKILPDFDQETPDFYRWRVVIAQEELQELLRKKLGVDFGGIHRLEAVERGGSGRIVQLRIAGERETLVVGKELEIRRALSPSHLYSSAFVVETGELRARVPSQFTLIGAGWGHGVGLCQIGAALMAERGHDHRRILEHYYRGARLYGLYSAVA